MHQIEVFRPHFNRGKPPGNRVSTYLRTIFYSRLYTYFVFSCVCISGGFLLATHAGGHGDLLPDDHDTFERVIDIQNMVLTFELAGEVILALVALGPRLFFARGWMVFDFTVAAGMLVGFVGMYAEVPGEHRKVLVSFTTVARSLRAVRALRILTFLRLTRGIVRTLISCVPKLVCLDVALGREGEGEGWRGGGG